jgi:uncharacterized protein
VSKEIKHLFIFLLATFAWTWGFYAPLALGQHDPYQMPWTICLILGGMGPSVVGIAMIMLTGTSSQRKDYWLRVVSVKRIRFVGWVVILLIFPLVYGLGIALAMLLGSPAPGMKELTDLMANPVLWLLVGFISFVSGPFSEEFGWRGYALERILRNAGSFWGTLGLGVIWALWHLPLYFAPNTWYSKMGLGLAGIWSFIAMNVGVSFIMTVVYFSCSRSILAGMLLHFTSNFTSQLYAPAGAKIEISRSFSVLAAGLVIYWLMKRHVDSRLLEFIQGNPTA